MINFFRRLRGSDKIHIDTIAKIILRNGFSAIVIIDRKGRVLEWNFNAEKLFGWSEKEAVGKKITHLVIPRRFHSKHVLGVKEFFQTKNNKIINGGEVPLTARHKDGYEFKVAARVNHVVTKGKDVFVALVSDRSIDAKIEEERKAYATELNHRIKTLMTIIQSITKQTLVTADPEEVGALLSRMFAMDKAINLLYQTNWKSANLHSLIYDITYSYGNHKQFNLSGSKDIELNGSNAISFALIIYELCANSIKYGALKDGYKGKVDINWHVSDNSLIWHWSESGGPPVTEPHEIGFGLQFAKRAFTGQGTTIVEYPETGLSCTIVLKLGKVDKS